MSLTTDDLKALAAHHHKQAATDRSVAGVLADSGAPIAIHLEARADWHDHMAAGLSDLAAERALTALDLLTSNTPGDDAISA